jgi:hypothetical protein
MANRVLERMVAERERTDEQIDEVLATIEGEERDPSPAERELLARMRTRRAELEEQIGPLADMETERADSRDVHGVLARAARVTVTVDDSGNGNAGQQGAAGVPPVIHRTAGQFIVDYLRARGGMRDMGGREAPPDPMAIERMGPWLQRVLSNQTTADTPGLLPEPIIGEVLGQKALVQPFLSSIGGAKPMGGIPGKTFSRPKITQHTVVGVQANEKTELPSRKMTIGGIAFTKVTKGGVVDISRQDIDWTVPSAWDILLRDLAAVYGEEVEEEVAADAADKAAGGPIAVASNDLDGWAAALYQAAAAVYAATTPRRLPNRVWMSLDVWAQAGPIIDVAIVKAGAQVADLVSSQGAAGFAGNMFAVPRYVVPSWPDGTCIVGVDAAYECYEEVVGVLSAVEPALFGVQVAYGGYVAFNAVEPEGMCAITPPVVVLDGSA